MQETGGRRDDQPTPAQNGVDIAFQLHGSYRLLVTGRA